MKKFNDAARYQSPTLHIVECGCCGCYHPEDFQGDCRDDENRFASPEDAEMRTGKIVVATDLE